MTDRMRQVSREDVEQLALFDGPDSNAAIALLEADVTDGPVDFYYYRDAILVSKPDKSQGVLFNNH